MKIKCRVLLLVLVISMLMSACAPGSATTETTEPSAEPTVEATEALTVPNETEAPREEVSRSVSYSLKETVLPTEDKATGTLCFYINDKTIYAGGPVADLIEAGVHTYDDLSKVIEPWHMSEVVRVRVDIPDTEEKDEPLLFFVAVNASDEPKMISECLFYSLTVNCEKGIEFGSGNEAEHFVSGVTKKEDIVAAYGEPTESSSRSTLYEEIAYYEPFSCAYFSFYRGAVRQIFTYYSANIFGDLAEEFEHEYYGGYYGADCYILLDQYMDVEAYLPEKESDEKKESDETEEEENKTGIVKKLEESILLDGKKIELGCHSVEMPDPWGKPFEGLQVPIARNYYLRIGITNEEEFYFINTEGMSGQMADYAVVKGVITENRNYTNWGVDNSGFYEFDYMGLTNDATIEDIIEQYGMPREVHCTSYARACFAWLHYEDENGNTLRLRVDPSLNQIVELRVSKYFEDEHSY